MRKDISPRWDVSPERDTFQSAFTIFQLVCISISSSYVTFIVYLFFFFNFNFELPISILTAQFYKMNCTFLHNG